MNTQPRTTAYTDFQIFTWTHRPTNPHAHLRVDRQTRDRWPPFSSECQSWSPSSCHLLLLSPWKETGDAVGIRCQFPRKPSSVSAGLQGNAAPAAAPWPSGQLAWTRADFSRDAGCPQLPEFAGKRHPLLQSAHVWDTGPRSSLFESLLPSEQAGRPGGMSLLRFLELPLC